MRVHTYFAAHFMRVAHQKRLRQTDRHTTCVQHKKHSGWDRQTGCLRGERNGSEINLANQHQVVEQRSSLGMFINIKYFFDLND